MQMKKHGTSEREESHGVIEKKDFVVIEFISIRTLATSGLLALDIFKEIFFRWPLPLPRLWQWLSFDAFLIGEHPRERAEE